MQASSDSNKSRSWRPVSLQRLSRSTCSRLIGSTYGLRSSIERCSVGSRSSSALRLLDARAPARATSLNSSRSLTPKCRCRASRELFVGGRDVEIGARQRRLEIVDERGEEVPFRVRRARDAEAQLFDGGRAGPTPAPNQAGSMWRDCVHANTHGTARKRVEAFLAGPHGGARADLHARDHVDGRHGLEPAVEVRVAVHAGAGMPGGSRSPRAPRTAAARAAACMPVAAPPMRQCAAH